MSKSLKIKIKIKDKESKTDAPSFSTLRGFHSCSLGSRSLTIRAGSNYVIVIEIVIDYAKMM